MLDHGLKNGPVQGTEASTAVFFKGNQPPQCKGKAALSTAERLDNRPRKCLNYQTPVEVFTQALRGALAI